MSCTKSFHTVRGGHGFFPSLVYLKQPAYNSPSAEGTHFRVTDSVPREWACPGKSTIDSVHFLLLSLLSPDHFPLPNANGSGWQRLSLALIKHIGIEKALIYGSAGDMRTVESLVVCGHTHTDIWSCTHVYTQSCTRMYTYARVCACP